MPGALCTQDGERRARHVDHAPEVGLDLGAEVLLGKVLDRVDVRVARVVDDDVEPAEGLVGRPHGGIGLGAVGDVERERLDTPGVALRELGELLGSTRGCQQLVALGEHGLRERAAKAARAACDEPGKGHGRSPWVRVRSRRNIPPFSY